MRRRNLDKTPRDYGNRKEKEVIKRGGYRATPGSGSSSVKGDLRRGDFMIEVKSTIRNSFSVTPQIMGKLANDGLTNGLKGLLIVQLGNGESYAVMPLKTFEELVPHDQV